MHFVQDTRKSRKSGISFCERRIYCLVSRTSKIQSESVLNSVDEMNFVTYRVMKCNEQKSFHMQNAFHNPQNLFRSL